MGRYKFIAYHQATTRRFIVLWDLQWKIIDCQIILPHSDLSAAMTDAMQRLAAQGWEPEGTLSYGFVFIRRHGERRMLMLTSRDPCCTSLQSFDPFKSSDPGNRPR